VRVVSDVVTAEAIEHRVITLPVVANLDGTDHVEPTVESSLVRFQAAQAREAAIEQADGGDLDGAAETLHEASAMLCCYASDPVVAEEMEDLRAESERLQRGEYSSGDRKYHEARSHARHEGKEAFIGKLSRRREKK